MDQLPKIVPERLKGTATAGVHPDPDLLAAFLEKSLKPAEQAEVVGHLASCADCREIASLAAPELQLQRVAVAAGSPVSAVAAMPAVAARSPRWFQSQFLRWGAAVACVAVVAAAVLLSRKQNNQFASVTPTVAPVPQVSSDESDKDKDESVARNVVRRNYQLQDRLKKKSGAPSRDEEAFRAPASAQTAGSAGASFGTGGGVSGGLVTNSKTTVAAKVPPPPPLPLSIAHDQANQDLPVVGRNTAALTTDQAKQKEEVADKKPAAPISTSESVTVNATQIEVQGEAAPVQEPAKSVEANKDLDLKSTEISHGYAARAIGSFHSDLRLPVPRWTLSPEGRLLESADAGVSWKTVPVAEKTVLRALCVNGKEVWVGGAQGTLYYTSDSGARWEQVKPAANGRTLTADIATIEFTDPQHGKLTTANKEIWTTADGGKSWQAN